MALLADADAEPLRGVQRAAIVTTWMPTGLAQLVAAGAATRPHEADLEVTPPAPRSATVQS